MSDKATEQVTGGCLCGAVRFTATGKLRPVVLCHCGQCRKWHGHVGAYTAVDHGGFKLTEQRGLRWFDSSAIAKRGFCAECGSSLFWQGKGKPYISIAAGTLDPPTHLKSDRHFFVVDKGDYYEIDEHLPQNPQGF